MVIQVETDSVWSVGTLSTAQEGSSKRDEEAMGLRKTENRMLQGM